MLKAESQDSIINIEKDSNIIKYLPILKNQNSNLNLQIPSNSKKVKEFEHGKIILLNGDTIFGKIEIVNIGSDERDFGKLTGNHSFNPNIMFGLFPIKIRFCDDKDTGNVKKYKADKIKWFEKGNKYYYSKKTDELPPFYIERVIAGKLNLYVYKYHRKNDLYNGTYKLDYQIDYYIDGEENKIIKLDCSNLENFIKDNFSNYSKFIETTTKKKSGLKKIVTGDPYEYNSCDYILEIVQLYNILHNKK